MAALPNHSHSGYATTAQLGNYLPLTGGTLTGTASSILAINRTGGNNPLIAFYSDSTLVGFLGIDTDYSPCYVDPVNYGKYALLHSGNYTTYCAPATHAHNYAGSSSAGGAATSVVVGTGSSSAYRPIVVHNGNSLYSAGDATGKPRYNYSTGDVKAKSFTTDGGNFVGNVTGTASGNLPLTGGTLATTASTILSLNNTNSVNNEIGLRLDMNSSSKGWVGYTTNAGTYLYTYAGPHKLGIKEDGTGFIDGNTIIHSGNIGQQSVASATNATNASNIYINNSSSSGAFPVTFVSNTTKGSQALFVSTGKSLTFNPSTGVLTATKFVGNLIGNANTATNATSATLSAATNKLNCTDSRNVSILPKEITTGIVADFKAKAITGLTSTYSGVITFRSYGAESDLSGGPVYQIAMDLAGIHSRTSKDASTWNTWLNILDSSNYTIYCASVGHTHSSINDSASGAATTFAYSKSGLNYDDYSWLAGWNGYELRAVNKSQFAQASHTHSYLPKSGGTMTGDIAMGSTSENTITTNKIDSGFQELTHKNKYGYIALGPFNADHAHIYTDRNNFYFNKTITVNGTPVSLEGHTHSGYSTTDTKNTAGSSNKKTKIFVVGAASQNSTGVTTYSDVSVYITDGKLYASNFITSSDERIKTNIKEVKNSVDSLGLRFVEFDYKDSSNHSAGHIAQEVKEVLPEFVHEDKGEEHMLSVDYTGLHSVQIKALLDRIIKLEEEIKQLKSSSR